MAAITINDLHAEREMNHAAMAGIKGASGALWVFGWIRAYVDVSPRFGSVVNFFQTNNFYIADQINNQIEVIDVNNSATNASIDVSAKQQSINFKQV
jgi:hypothetical protein